MPPLNVLTLSLNTSLQIVHPCNRKKIDKLGYNNSLDYKMYINKNLYLCYQGRIFCENDVSHNSVCIYTKMLALVISMSQCDRIPVEFYFVFFSLSYLYFLSFCDNISARNTKMKKVAETASENILVLLMFYSRKQQAI